MMVNDLYDVVLNTPIIKLRRRRASSRFLTILTDNITVKKLTTMTEMLVLCFPRKSAVDGKKNSSKKLKVSNSYTVNDLHYNTHPVDQVQ
jgi:hypothetical protein